MPALRGSVDAQSEGGTMSNMQEMMDAQSSDERMCYEVAARLHFAMTDGYLTADEFQHVLAKMGILNNWKKERDSGQKRINS